MRTQPNRRQFLGTCGAAAAMSLCSIASASAGEAPPGGGMPAPRPVTPNAKGTLPTGKLGKLSFSRLISGGNLLSGWCHQPSRSV